MRLNKPALLLIGAALVTAGVGLHQQETIAIAERVAAMPAAAPILYISSIEREPATPPTYTADMDVSWHAWHPIGRAAGVIPVALLDLAEEYGISPVYAAAVFVLESGWGSSQAWLDRHNPAGIRCGNRYCSYTTATDGLRRMFEIMANYYANGRTTVDQQRSLWSEADDTDQIIQLMNQLAEGE